MNTLTGRRKRVKVDQNRVQDFIGGLTWLTITIIDKNRGEKFELLFEKFKKFKRILLKFIFLFLPLAVHF